MGDSSKLSVLQINTYGISGGAGRAGYRLHKGLLAAGEDSKYLVKEIDREILTVFKADYDRRYNKQFILDHLINKYYIFLNRTELSNTYFSFSHPGYDLVRSHLVDKADIFNLHWVEDFLSPVSLGRLFSLGKPVVWTLHDQKPFTGGCHYSAGCRRYEDDCLGCPQLAENPYNLPYAILKDKMELFSEADLTIVAPSAWLAGEARKSRLFKNNRVETIPNSLETDIFYPADKRDYKNKFGIGPDVTTMMFGAFDASDNRKGFKNLLNAIGHCLRDKNFKGLVERKKIMILIVGKPDEAIEKLNIPLLNKGYIDNDEEMAALYNASDLFVLPSLEDNLPNTMLEAMACGTPVVAFDVGGMADVIIDNENGRLVALNHDSQFGEAILELVFDPSKRNRLGVNGSRLIKEKYKLENQANNYLDLYRDLLNKPSFNKAGWNNRNTVSQRLYGKHTEKIYGDLMCFSLEALIRRNSKFTVRSRIALKMCEYALRAAVAIVPDSKIVSWSRILN